MTISDIDEAPSWNCSCVPMLTPEEEREYLQKLAITTHRTEREAIRNEIAMRNLNLVWYVVRRFCRQRGIELTNRDILDELFQSGVIGLIWAIDRFDCSVYTNRLSTYAVPWIYQSVSRAWGAIRTTVHVPMAMAERRAPLPVSECSLDAPLPGKMGDERQQTMGDLIAWHDPDIDLRIVITNALSPLEATAIRGYFGIGMPRMDYTSLAQLLQVSKGDVARIIDTGIRRLTLVLVEEADVER